MKELATQKVSLGEKIGYSMGDAAANLVFQMMMYGCIWTGWCCGWQYPDDRQLVGNRDRSSCRHPL